MGYEVTKCKVEAQIADTEEDTKITKIKLNIEKSENSNSDESVKNNYTKNKNY